MHEYEPLIAIIATIHGQSTKKASFRYNSGVRAVQKCAALVGLETCSKMCIWSLVLFTIQYYLVVIIYYLLDKKKIGLETVDNEPSEVS